jgi:N-acetylglutamate synthase-like GNAT family acetyltransferase
MTIEKANTDDNEILTEITKKSKAYWGYSNEQMELWSELLTITRNYIETKNVFKLVLDSIIAGYYSFFSLEEETVKLDNLFILPDYIGKGHGRALMDDFLSRLKQRNVKKVLVDSEPYAEKFYSKFGFIRVGQLETSVKDRYLPIMELRINYF